MANGTGLENSPHLFRIYTMLRAGQHPWIIAATLKRLEGVEVDPEDIAKYLARIPESELPAPSMLKRKFGDIITDPLSDLHRIILLRQERIERLLELEEREGRLYPRVDGLLAELFSDTIALASMMPGQKGRIQDNEGQSQNGITLIQILRAREKDETIDGQWQAIDG
jgi:hypothetical protein